MKLFGNTGTRGVPPARAGRREREAAHAPAAPERPPERGSATATAVLERPEDIPAAAREYPEEIPAAAREYPEETAAPAREYPEETPAPVTRYPEEIPAAAPDYPEEAPAAKPERPASGAKRFRRGYLIYVLCLLALIAAGLTLLWIRMSVYERSRPVRAVEAWMESSTAADWKRTLTELEIEPGFIDTLDLEHPEYYKNLGIYTDETPAYNVSFNGRALLTARLEQGESLGFGSHSWVLASVEAVDSGFAVYVPDDAAVLVGGVPAGQEYLVQRNAQPLTLGELESGREDIPGLAKYVFNRIFTTDSIRVVAADGSELAPAYSTGSATYYAPLTMDCRILVPEGAEVTVNGIRLTEANAAAETVEPETDPYEIFEGIESALPFPIERQGRTAWTVEGLVAAPEVTATLPDGTALQAQRGENVWDFPSPSVCTPDPALQAELHDMIMDVFDAHIAYLGNRGKDLASNYSRFSKYLVPGSEAALQAWGAQVSLVWIHDMDTFPDAELKEVLRYAPDCFTAQVDFTADAESGGAHHSNIYIFIQSGGAWKVLRIVSK